MGASSPVVFALAIGGAGGPAPGPPVATPATEADQAAQDERVAPTDNEVAPALSWDAPTGCPDQAALTAQIERHLGGDLMEPRASPVSATAEIVRWRTGFVLRISIRSQSGTRRREIAGGDCQELTRVAALLVAIAIDPGMGTEAQAAPPPEPEAQTPTPPPEVAPHVDPSPKPAESERKIGGALTVAVGATVGPLPGPAALITAAGAIRVRWFSAHALIGHRLAKTAVSREGAGARAEVWSTTGELGACGWLTVSPVVEFPLCLGIEAGALSGRSRGIVRAAKGAGLWFAARAGGGVVVLPIPRVGFALDVDAVVPFSRPGFSVGGAGELHRAGSVGVDATVGLQVRFGALGSRER